MRRGLLLLWLAAVLCGAPGALHGFLSDTSLSSQNAFGAAATFPTDGVWEEPPINAPGGTPNPRGGHVAVYDAATNRMIVHGGGEAFAQECDEPGDCMHDAWVLTGADGTDGPGEWVFLTSTPPEAPPGRSEHSAIYDAASNRMVIFGGSRRLGPCSPGQNDVWALTHANGLGGSPAWVEISPLGTPPSPRAYHSAEYDAASDRMMVFGGSDVCGPGLAEVWVLEHPSGVGGTPQWTQLSPAGAPPAARIAYGSGYDATTNRLVIHGGIASDADILPYGDAWVLTNANGLGGTPEWIELHPTGSAPGPRSFQSATYDAVENALVVFGGCCTVGGARLGDVWKLSDANGLGPAASWNLLRTAGGAPEARDTHTAVYETSSHRTVVFGGRVCPGGACHAVADTWVLREP